MTAPHPRADYSESVQVKRKRSDWVVDPVEAQRGAEAWAERDRVILVLGSEHLFNRIQNCGSVWR